MIGKNVKIVVIDSGIFFYDDLLIVGGYLVVSYIFFYKDDNGYGIYVVGIIGVKYNGYGIDGIVLEV